MLAEAQNGVVPDNLGEQLAAVEAAARNFDAFSHLATRAILERIAGAKRPETRQPGECEDTIQTARRGRPDAASCAPAPRPSRPFR